MLPRGKQVGGNSKNHQRCSDPKREPRRACGLGMANGRDLSQKQAETRHDEAKAH